MTTLDFNDFLHQNKFLLSIKFVLLAPLMCL